MSKRSFVLGTIFLVLTPLILTACASSKVDEQRKLDEERKTRLQAESSRRREELKPKVAQLKQGMSVLEVQNITGLSHLSTKLDNQLSRIRLSPGGLVIVTESGYDFAFDSERKLQGASPE